MADEKRERYPKNVPGPFFVENGFCIACEAPEYFAPDLIGHDENDEVIYHCYFKKQPTTPEETGRAIQAVWHSCCQAVQYDGDDPQILQRFADLEAELKIQLGEEEWRRQGYGKGT